jgi:phasin family protein
MATKTPKKTPTPTQIEETVATTEAKVQNGSAPLFKAYGELSQLGQGNLEAVVAANQALARGAEEISKEIFGIAQASFENAASAAKAFLSVKTLQDVIELNNTFAKDTLEAFLANSAKLSELTFKVTSEATQPLKARVDVAIEKLSTPGVA